MIDPGTLQNATYLGDGLYAGTQVDKIVLYSFDGIRVLNQVFLEPQVLLAFSHWAKEVLEREEKPT